MVTPSGNRFRERRAQGLCAGCKVPSERPYCDDCRALRNKRDSERRWKKLEFNKRFKATVCDVSGQVFISED